MSGIEREVEGMEFPDEVWADLVEVTVEEYEKVLGRERARIAALVALCEEVIDAYDMKEDESLAPYQSPDDYRQRLAQLQGAG